MDTDRIPDIPTIKTPLEALLERMDQGSDFPALSRTINDINRLVGNENSRADRITEIILRDIALTKKLLRLVNAAHLGLFGGQPISTISRAVVILGFDAVRDAAVSLLLFEHLANKAQGDELKAEAVESFYRGILGRLLAASLGVRDREEAFISALFRDLGRLMARFHFYEDTKRIEALMAEEMLDEQSAALRVFGIDYDQLGLGLARHWRFPASILHAMTPLDDGPVRSGIGEGERLRVAANLARDLHLELAGKDPEAQEQAIEALCQRYQAAGKIDRDKLAETVRKAVETLRTEAPIIGVDMNKSPLLRSLARWSGAMSADVPGDDALAQAREQATADIDGVDDAAGVLAQGMQDITAMMLGNFHLADIFKTVAELMYRSGLFDHVLLCTLDRPSQSLVGRVGMGRKAASMRAGFRIPLSFAPDVFHAATAKGQDILISDTAAANIRARIPDWYFRVADARAFLLLPIMLHDKPLGLIYADKSRDDLRIPSQALGLLKALRNQAALALRQKL